MPIRDKSIFLGVQHLFRTMTTEHITSADSRSLVGTLRFPSTDHLDLDLDVYRGRVALWGAVPAIYDTTCNQMDRGIHVHARTDRTGRKVIDQTFGGVTICGNGIPQKGIRISGMEAIYFMISSVLGFTIARVVCSYCGASHLDEGSYCVSPRRVRKCGRCSNVFASDPTVIANPIGSLQEQFGTQHMDPVLSGKELDIKQSQFVGGIQIWGSNSAFFRTDGGAEEYGIHVHAFRGKCEEPSIDDTFSKVIVDGVALHCEAVRLLMAQQVIPHLRGRIVSSICPNCKNDQISTGRSSYTLTSVHECVKCHESFVLSPDGCGVVCNPSVSQIERLRHHSVRTPRDDQVDLMCKFLGKW